MSSSSLKLSLLSPRSYKINLGNQQNNFTLRNSTQIVPYGTARLTIHTTDYWTTNIDYVPSAGEIIVYSDKTVIDGVTYPGVKIGDGKAYCVDLPFLNEDANNMIIEMLNNHINDTSAHVVPGERETWNNKVSCSIQGERLIFEGDDF